jgi:hypothetical protein
MTQAAVADATQPLSPRLQRRGRYLAIASHPFGMIQRMALVGDLATQALVTLGATPGLVGLQAAFAPFATLVQLPSLRAQGRWGKRRLLLGTQLLSLITGLPLIWFGTLAGLGVWALPVFMTSLAATIVLLVAGSTAWWPILHGFVPEARTGRFFAVLRSVWHVGLILYFLFSAWWLSAHPGQFGLLFGLAWGCGLVRAGMLLVFPERRDAEPPRPGPAWKRLLAPGPLRRYLVGVSLDTVVFRLLGPFAIVMLRREAGLTEAQTMITTLAVYGGGLVALYPAGRVVDKVGARSVLLASCGLRAVVVAGVGVLALVASPQVLLWGAGALFLVFALLGQAFGLAEVKVLFALVPGDSPSPYIVTSMVTRSVVASVVALAAGGSLELLLRAGIDPGLVYLGLFGALALIQAAAVIPFRGLERGRE